jgi:hypothetical protein
MMQPNTTQKWSSSDLSNALHYAILSSANHKRIKQSNGKILFNGFWRGGDKQNVCAWLDRATWHDAKTGEGGGVKDFAAVAFNLSLPEFMARFCSIPVPIRPAVQLVARQALEPVSLESSWRALESRRPETADAAALWLQNARGIERPRETTYSGFESITVDDAVLFPRMQQAFLKDRLAQGSFLAAPIRSAKT